ncbi:hypothetical protein MW887_011968 [Aspergillus wentii]|nr:hypothetical protein MW887_011968 [Aspergillus wentii]
MPAKIRLSHSEYTVGWICALPLEMAAATVMLDEVHETLLTQLTDHNSYTLGRIGKHNVVVTCLPAGEPGIAPAAIVATQLSSSFQSIRFCLMVGIGGGVPNTDLDIRLGDVVVSQPTGTHGGVIQYDYGKALNGGSFERRGMVNCPPLMLRTALSKLQASHLIEDSQVMGFLAEMKRKIPEHNTTKFARPTRPDHLYLTDYNHVNINAKTCAGCDIRKTVLRPPRDHDRPVIHYGLIASANQVMKDGRRRDQLAQEFGVYCVEMEAAGLKDYPCLVIRGISDYADSHKNDEWQGYAATVAAAYAKELLYVVETSHANTFPAQVKETMSSDPMVVTATPKTPDLSGLSLDRTKFQDDIQENTVPDKDKHILSAIDLTNDDSTIRATPRQSSQEETRHPERTQNNKIKNDGYTLKGHSGLVTSVAFSPDGKTIGSGSLDHTVRLWNTATNATSLILSNHSDRVDTVLFSPDGKRLASVSRDRTVWLWDSLTGAKIFMRNGHDDRVNTMGFSTDGTLLASGTLGKEVKLWDTATGSTRKILNHPASRLTAVAFSSDRMVASEICNGTPRLWNSTTGEFQTMGTLNGQVNHMCARH